jgi:zinc protease
MIRKSILALAVSSLTLCASASAVARSTMAKAAPLQSLIKSVDIPYKQFTLNNGLRVLVHTDKKAPLVAVSVWYGVGSKNEPKGKTGFAHLFEHLMFNGSENASGDFFEPLQQIGATDYNGTTWFDRTNYFETVPTGALDRALFLESDRMGHLLGGITQEKLTNQIGVVQNEKRQGDNAPYGLVEYDQLEMLYPSGHPYHHSTIGSMADLSSASLDDVKQWFRDNYGPNNAVLVLAGDIDLATAKQKVSTWFGDIPRGREVPKVRVPVTSMTAPYAKTIKDQVATTRLYRMWAVPGLDDPDYIELSLAASVLGGLSSSRLDNSLVRGDPVAVGVSASAQIFAQGGQFVVQADVKPGTDAALVADKLDAVIAKFIAEGPTKDELDRATTRYLAGQLSQFESVGGFGGRAPTLAEGLLYSGNPAQYKIDLKRAADSTPERVKAIAARWLSRPAFSLTVEPGARAEGGENRAAFVVGSQSVKASPVQSPAYYRDPASQDLESAPRLFDGDRSKMPEVGQLTALTFPKIERAKLKNGVEVYFAKRATVPMVQVSVAIDAGYAADPKSALGTQSLMLSMMAEGTKNLDSRQLAEEQERLGMTIAPSADLDNTYFFLSALKANLTPSLNLLADFIRNPAFDAKELERVRAKQLAGISAELKDPSSIGRRVLLPEIYGKAHPYGVPPSGSGYPAVVSKLTSQELRSFHDQWLRPDMTKIFVVGDSDLKTVKAALNKSFGGWTVPKGAKPVKDFSAAIPAPANKIILIDRPNSPQSVIRAGVVLPHKGSEDLPELGAAMDVLGGSFLSRLNSNLRETKGWSYGVGLGGTDGRESIAMLIRAPVQADKTGDSIRELISDTKAFIGEKGVTAEELERTVNGMVRELPGSFETSRDVLGGIVAIVKNGRSDNYYEKRPEVLRGLTQKSVDEAARKDIDPSKLTFVVVGDAKMVKPQLEGLGLPIEERAATDTPAN